MAAVLLSASPLSAQTWNLGTGGSWNTAANWSPAAVPNTVGASVTFNGAATGSNVVQTANRTVTTDGAQTVGSFRFNSDQSTFTTSVTAGTGGSLVLDETGTGPVVINVPAAAGTGNNTISAPTTFADDVVANVNNVTASSAAGALNLTATITGAGGFTKNGDGLATFGTGAKTFTGAMVVNGGRMRLSLAAAPTGVSSFTINAGGQLTIINPGSGIVPQTFTFGSGPLNLSGVGSANLPYSAFPGAIRNDTGNQSIINNQVVLQTDTLLHVQGTTGFLTLANTVSGSGKLTLTGQPHDANLGTLNLNGANTYAGGTVVDGGILSVSGANATLGTGDVTVNSSSAVFVNANAKLQIQSGVANAIADTATLSLAGGNVVGVADDGCIDLGAGVNETVGALKLGGVTQVAGTYGSTASTATFQNDEYFSGTGIITVVGGPAPKPSLTISLASPDVVLTWPTNSTGYTLQEIAVLNSTLNWSNVNASVIVSGTNNTVTVPATNINFFRLIK